MPAYEKPPARPVDVYWNSIGWSGTVTKVNIKPIFGKNENIVQLLKEQIDERREKFGPACETEKKPERKHT
jgi:hypothetical protein